MNCPPPKDFKPAGNVREAHFCEKPPFIHYQRRSGRRAQGVRYERKVHEHFCKLFGEAYVASPWIKFKSDVDERWRWCQPDALYFDLAAGRIVILEVKYQHTSDAWWQLRQLYAPVLRSMFPYDLWRIQCCEVVKWFDPATAFPERVEMVPTPLDVKDFGVHIWKAYRD